MTPFAKALRYRRLAARETNKAIISLLTGWPMTSRAGRAREQLRLVVRRWSCRCPQGSRRARCSGRRRSRRPEAC